MVLCQLAILKRQEQSFLGFSSPTHRHDQGVSKRERCHCRRTGIRYSKTLVAVFKTKVVPSPLQRTSAPARSGDCSLQIATIAWRRRAGMAATGLGGMVPPPAPQVRSHLATRPPALGYLGCLWKRPGRSKKWR